MHAEFSVMEERDFSRNKQEIKNEKKDVVNEVKMLA
jgi:hypothetical protein